MDVDSDSGCSLVMDVEARVEGRNKKNGEGCLGGETSGVLYNTAVTHAGHLPAYL